MEFYRFESQTSPDVQVPTDRIACVYVSKNDLTGDQNVLGNYVKTASNRPIEICGRFSEPTMKALWTFLDLLNRPCTCVKNSEESQNTISVAASSRARETTLASEEGEEDDADWTDARDDALPSSEGDGTSSKDESKVYHDGTELRNRADLYVETQYAPTVEDAEEVAAWNRYDEWQDNEIMFGDDEWDSLSDAAKETKIAEAESRLGRFRRTRPDVGIPEGWRFWFVANDPVLSWDTGVVFKSSEKLDRKSSRNFWNWVRSVEDWIKDGVSPYADFRFHRDTPETKSAYLYPLWDACNPARSDSIFSFKRSVGPSCVNGPQGSIDSYFEHGKLVRFPYGARRVPLSMRDPSMFFTAKMERPPYETIESNESKNSVCMRMTIANDESDMDTMSQQAADGFANDGKTLEDQRRLADRFANWMSGPYAPPGIAAAWAHLKPLVGSVVVPEEDPFVWDDTLSDFGNMIVEAMMAFETVMDVDHLHAESLFSVLNALGAFRLAKDLRVHVANLGPPASGKTFIQELMQLLFPKGTFENVSYQTKRANTTETSQDCMVLVYDEIADALADKSVNGTGSSELKQIMTEGVIYTEQCVVDETTRKRLKTKTKSRCNVQLNINGNCSRFAFPAPILDRLFVRCIPARPPAEGGTDSALSGMNANDTAGAKEATILKYKTLISIVAVLSHAIDMKWLHDVDMTYGNSIVKRFFENMKLIRVDPRTRRRVPLYVRPLVLFYAAYMVFGTNRHFEPGTPFETSRLVECQRYFRATREIVYFGITHMQEAFVDPNAKHVYAAVKRLIEKQSTRHPTLRNEWIAKRENEYVAGNKKYTAEEMVIVTSHPNECTEDKRRFLLLSGFVGNEKYKIRTTIVENVCAEIKAENKVTFSSEMVRDILDGMEKSGGLDTYGIPILDYQMTGNYSTFGMTFSCEFLDTDKSGIVKDAIRSTFDTFVPDGTRFVLGTAFRDGIPQGEYPEIQGKARDTPYPHLLEVLRKRTEDGKTQIVRNPNFRPFGFDKFVPKSRRSECVVVRPFVRIDGDIDAAEEKRHLDEYGFQPIPPRPPNVAENSMSYPLDYFKLHNKGYDTTDYEGNESIEGEDVMREETYCHDDDTYGVENMEINDENRNRNES